MKKQAISMLAAGLLLSGCGSAPPQISGNNRVSIGVSASDVASSVNVTRSYTPESVDEKGKVTPAKTDWAVSEAGAVSFVFMARPGSDAAYITGYRILRYDYNGSVSTTARESNKLDIYVPSGYTCPERESLPSYQSCAMFTADGSFKSDTVQANGQPTAPLTLNFANALVSEVKSTLRDAYSTVDLEFIGHSSNGHPVSVIVKGISSRAYKLGN
ncbi:hypothetical protein ACINK0_08655 [Deinococcus sp. VB343]|uniref:Lipoprotein n=1 Tax=Deinococcus sp. VB142 TaxID=3112952 RepID=A0AAU6Q5U0_9DEIO